MKIAVLSHLHFPITEPYAGGLEMHTHMLVNELVARGHDVTIYAKAGTKTDAKLFVVVGKHFTFKQYKSKIMTELQEGRMHLAEYASILHMRSQNYDVVINNSLSPLPYTRLQRTPMITILHTPATLERVNKIIEKHSWSPSPLHRYVSVSKSNSIGWKQLLPEVAIVPNGIRMEDWNAKTKVVPNLAVWSGRITKEKGLHIAVKAAKLAGMKLKIAGPIYDQNYYDTQIQPEVDDSIEYVGHLDHADLASFYASAEVALSSPIWDEPFGLSTIEAIASGTPVAVLPHGAMSEIVSKDVGTISKDDSPEAFAKAIEKAQKINRSACKTYAKNFTIKVMVDRYETIIADIQKSSESSPAWKNV